MAIGVDGAEVKVEVVDVDLTPKIEQVVIIDVLASKGLRLE